MVATPEKPSLKPNAQDLQGDVIDCLEKIVELMGRARDILSGERHGDNSGEKYGVFQQEIKNAAQNVQQLELRMAVVAPMKAGKSTIVNAIVGQDLLPSRNAAMTTLPTEIVFKDGIQEPILILSEEIQQVFQNTLVSLNNKIREDGPEIIQEKTAQYPHLLELLKEIQTQPLFISKGSVTGRERITEQLTKLNDIVRLCSVIDPIKDPLNQLFDVIRIETPFLNSQETNQTENLGKLVIIDTPGPNEAGENLRLTAVVEEQLKRSSIVLIVLDFTQLNNEAAEKVKKQVQPIIDLIGKNNLYVLVNKVDQRRKGDMSPEQVKEFVSADLNLSESSKIDSVFEIAAIRAFTAAKYLLECQQNSHLDLDKNATILQTAEALAQEVFGIDWEEDLEEATIEELQKKAKRLWKKSGFDLFLEKAINALMESAAPRCMLSALNLSRNRLLNITDDLKLRNSAILKDEQKLREEVDALEADLKRIDLSRIQLKEVEKIRANLQSNLNKVLESLKEEAQVNIEDYFREESYQLAPTFQKFDIIIRELFLIPISNFAPFGFSHKIKSALEYKSSNTIEFKTKQEADNFANDAIAWAKQRAETLLASTRDYSIKEIDKARKDLIEFLEKETKPIIDKARNRLNQEFDVELSFPQPPSWEDNNLEKTQILVNHSTRKKTIQRSDKKRRWYVLWLLEVEHTWEDTVDENYYYVSLDSLIDTFNNSITKAVANINSQFIQYIDEEFKEEIDRYLDYLDEYLCRYRDSLKQAQQDQQLSLEQKNELTQNLSTLIPETSNYVEKVDSYLERTESLMPESDEKLH
ncbi:dynamin family protein [Crocosphaera sp. XPORK-15E]|uniref:dynamin family protein n=1 Tax=Crocosphaera sp. XPORK-15E TaxID=3110247 RepID=UPI002B1FDD69|nr:dynamin family protein [Crocosphaera sp. XPORK-15E]MEA5536979.1 dynamin family protein [Crocosphaera sp. XPORK-15E]